MKSDKEFSPYEYRRHETETVKFSGLTLGGSEVPRVQVALERLDADGSLSEAKALLGLDASFQGTKNPADLKGKIRAEILEVPLSADISAASLKALRNFLAPFAALDFPVALALRFPRLEKDFAKFVEAKDFVVLSPSVATNENEWLATQRAFLASLPTKDLGIQWVVREEDVQPWAKKAWGEGAVASAQLALRLVRLSHEMGFAVTLPGFELVNPVASYRYLAGLLREENLRVPILLREAKVCTLTPDDLRTASVAGSLLCDGIGDALALQARGRTPYGRVRLAYNFLQATGSRITKTEFISCPSCGRTLFDLQDTTERIRSKMGHLKGLKLAIMGCIVNGPGEMADAHFGYVGAGPGRINLYVGKELVQKNIPQAEADQRLIDLIREHGMWSDPS